MRIERTGEADDHSLPVRGAGEPADQCGERDGSEDHIYADLPQVSLQEQPYPLP